MAISIFQPPICGARALVQRSKIVIVETIPNYPHVYGDLNAVHVSEVDYVIEGDGLTPAELKNPTATDVDRAVANYIAGESLMMVPVCRSALAACPMRSVRF